MALLVARAAAVRRLGCCLLQGLAVAPTGACDVLAVRQPARVLPVATGHPLAAAGARGIRDFPTQLLIRNHNFLRKVGGKAFEVQREWSLGIVLQPSEVKALRARHGDLSAAFAEFYKHELYLHQLHIPVWRNGLIGRPEAMRVRKLLANRSELKKLEEFMTHPNAQLIPMRLEVGNTGWIKVILAACHKQSQVDNRKRDSEREIKRQLRDW